MIDHLKFLLETEGNIFLTGKAGTGKSTSRCRTLEGINMFRKIYPSDIRKNEIIDNYLKENQNAARF